MVHLKIKGTITEDINHMQVKNRFLGWSNSWYAKFFECNMNAATACDTAANPLNHNL